MSDEFEAWRRETNEKIRAIDGLIKDLVALKNSYLMASFPGGEELSPARMRKLANSPWGSDGSK